MKVRSLNELSSQLADSLSWRIREISDLRAEIQKNHPPKQITFVRAGVALLYAHWEGFVRNAVVAYSKYLSSQNLRFDMLKVCFMGVPVKSEIKFILDTSRPGALGESVQKILDKRVEAVSINMENHVKNLGNLNYDLFINIVISLDLYNTFFDGRQKLIDERLLKNRNMIAHGNYVEVDEGGYLDLSDEVIALMRALKDEIENSAATKKYLTTA